MSRIPAVSARAQFVDGNGCLTRYGQLLLQGLKPGGSVTAEPGSSVVIVENVANVFTPNLSEGDVQYILLVADSIVNAPINTVAGRRWTLVIDQDATGSRNAVFDAAYFYSANLLGTGAASRRAMSNWIPDSDGNNSLSGTPSTDQPIPA